MPALKNPRHEQVALLISGGQSASDSYASVYGSDKGASQSARRLCKNARFCARVDELRHATVERSIEKTALSRAFVLESMMSVARRCMQVEPVRDSKGKETGAFTFNAPGAIRSLELLGKEVGCFRDAVDHTFQWDGDPSKLTAGQLAKLKAHFEAAAFGGDTAVMEKFKAEYLAAIAAPANGGGSVQ